MRSTLIGLLLLVSCTSYNALLEARRLAEKGDVTRSVKYYQRFIESLPADDSRKIYYSLELCDLYIRYEKLDEAANCLKDLKNFMDYSALIVPRIKQIGELFCKQRGYESSLNLLKNFINIDPEYMEGVIDEVLKLCISQGVKFLN